MLTASNTSGGSGIGVETWTYDGANWTLRATPAALKTAAHNVAYDSTRGRLVLFGGVSQSGGYRNDTWEYDDVAMTWTQIFPAVSPPARTNFAMAFDPVRGRVVIFGGYLAATSQRGDDTWEYDGTTWTAVTPPVRPAARQLARMAYDPMRERVLMFGGSNAAVTFGDVWEYDGTSWRSVAIDPTLPKPPAPSRAPMAYDGRAHKMVLFDTPYGSTTETWALAPERHAAAEACTFGVLDFDLDGDAGCSDAECWATCNPFCPPGASGATCTANQRCGDGMCAPVECGVCPSDCADSTGVCSAVCGDYVCALPETVGSCPGDCMP